MKRCLALSLVLVLTTALSAQAAISLMPGDTDLFVGQTPGLYVGGGGQMTWQVVTAVPRSNAPAPNTVFYAFCAQMNSPDSTISPGSTYTVGSIIAPVLGQAINKAGNILGDTQGLFLFDQWSVGNIIQSQDSAAAVQAALWTGEGYTAGDITGDGGYSSGQLANAQTLGASLLSSLGYTPSWQVAPSDEVVSFTTGQDQFVYADPAAVPEPASFLIWAMGLGLAGAASVVGRKETKLVPSLQA